MKLLFPLVLAAAIAAPALAQASRDDEIKAMLAGYAAAFNKGDTTVLSTKFIETTEPEKAKAMLDDQIAKLRADDFGKMDIYGVRVCETPDAIVAAMDYAFNYTAGGVMSPGDQTSLVMVKKTDDGWKIIQMQTLPANQKFFCPTDLPAPEVAAPVPASATP